MLLLIVVDDPYGQRKEATRTIRDPFEVSFIVQKVTNSYLLLQQTN